MPTISKDATYAVRSAKVFLNILIGEGQFGRHDVFLDDLRLVRVSGDIEDMFIGVGGEIVGKEVLVRTFGVDVNMRTNRMLLTYRLKGGTTSMEIASRGTVANQGGTLLFETTITMVSA